MEEQYISKGGRLTLIRSTMSSMPIYLMSLFHLPRKVRLRLEKIQRDFLWGGGTLAHKPHLVRWNLVCLEKRKGGLRVRNLFLMNNALLCKWNWRFANERDALWRSVISLKYGEEEGGWCTRDVMGRNGVGLWKAIRKKWGLFDGRVAFHSHLFFPCPCRRMLGFRRCGILLVMGMVGLPFLQGRLMIGRLI